MRLISNEELSLVSGGEYGGYYDPFQDEEYGKVKNIMTVIEIVGDIAEALERQKEIAKAPLPEGATSVSVDVTVKCKTGDGCEVELKINYTMKK